MAQPPKEERKHNLSNLPRGAIGIKGLPLSRNTRLPSIRNPRDLTLGAANKRTFLPNIPVRKEKKCQTPENVQTKQEIVKSEKKYNPQLNERGRGRGRSKQIIQTQNSIFAEGVASDHSMKKERARETYPKSDYSSSSRNITIKKERKDIDINAVSTKMDQLFRDDFIDDGDDEEDIVIFKPTVFPPVAQVKSETKTEEREPAKAFDPNIAKEMDFDVNQVAKFIKKEKGTDFVEDKKTVVPKQIPSNEVTNLFSGGTDSKLVLLQFPELINMAQKIDDPEPSHKKQNNADPKIPDNQDNSSSIKSLPEGYIGKIQVMRSGKAKLIIGSLEFNLDSISSLQSKHEVVSIQTDSSDGDLTVLGYLQQKLKFVPSEDCLLV